MQGWGQQRRNCIVCLRVLFCLCSLSRVDFLGVEIRYDTIAEFNVDSKAECDQLNLAHETKTNIRQCLLSSVQVKDPRRQSRRNEKTMMEELSRRQSESTTMTTLLCTLAPPTAFV